MPHPPQEIIDLIIDFLCDDPEALKRCCLISKTWVHRTRRHLFNHVNFKSPERLTAWKKFPDPGIHTRSLCFRRAEWVTDADLCWLRWFTNVKRLDVQCGEGSKARSFFAPFHNLSSAVKSLSVGWNNLPSREVFGFICSFPSLEDLNISGYGYLNDGDEVIDVGPLRLPVLNGTLVLGTVAADFARQLSELSNDLRFRKIVWRLDMENEFEGVGDLVARCSDTLESISISCLGPVDLSRATNLREVEFWLDSPAWVTATLETITLDHEHFKRVSIYIPSYPLPKGLDFARPGICLQWMDLDHILVRLWESHAISMKVTCDVDVDKDIKSLFPLATAKVRIEP